MVKITNKKANEIIDLLVKNNVSINCIETVEKILNLNVKKKRDYSQIKKIKKECEKVWKDVIKTRDGNKCVVCGNREYLQCHHIIPRHYYISRYLTENGVLLCRSCHFKLHRMSQFDYIDRIKEIVGNKRYENLLNIDKWEKVNDYGEVLERLKKEYQEVRK